MKKILLFSLALITLNSCETTPIEGCTDPNAINYNYKADINNNSCDFNSDIIFYLDQNAGIFLYNAGVQELTFYIDGVNIGSQYNDNGFFTSEINPECNDPYFTTGSVFWSNISYHTLSWEVEDELGNILFNSSSTLAGNECLAVQLTAKKLKYFMGNN